MGSVAGSLPASSGTCYPPITSLPTLPSCLHPRASPFTVLQTLSVRISSSSPSSPAPLAPAFPGNTGHPAMVTASSSRAGRGSSLTLDVPPLALSTSASFPLPAWFSTTRQGRCRSLGTDKPGGPCAWVCIKARRFCWCRGEALLSPFFRTNFQR